MGKSVAGAKVSSAQKPAKAPRVSGKKDVERDSFDFRDLIYRPALIPLKPAVLPVWSVIQILDQKRQGACTGFGLAAVINYLNAMAGDHTRVSARMLFELAKNYDQWPGRNYDHSSPRGAMKAWFKHGVCPEKDWPNHPRGKQDNHLTWERQKQALRYVPGAYYRVLPRRSDVHAALNEVGILYAAADTHDGWDTPDKKGRIPFAHGDTGGGGHAFAIIGYTAEGFIVQNSWGTDWGGFVDDQGETHPGAALWSYGDFDLNAWDIWVARGALPVESLTALGGARYTLASSGTRLSESGPRPEQIWNHYIHFDDGQFDAKGDYPSHENEVAAIVKRLVAGEDGAKAPQHLLLYAHGGLNSVDAAAKRAAKWRPVFQANGIAEIHFLWETGLLEELGDLLTGKEKRARERVAGPSSWWDTFIETVVQGAGGSLWSDMRSDAELPFMNRGAGTAFLNMLAAALASAGAKAPRLHLVGHSAGSILLGHLLARLRAQGGAKVENLVLFAPACTVDFFSTHLVPPLEDGTVGKLHHFLLDDRREQKDNVASIYRKSLLYLVSNALQDRSRTVPILGMEKFLPAARNLLAQRQLVNRVQEFNPRDHPNDTTSSTHGGFDNDGATMNRMLRIVLGAKPSRPFTGVDLQGY